MRPGQNRLLSEVLAATAAIACAAAAFGQAANPPRSPADGLLEALPQSCDAVAIITDAARQRRSPAGRGLQALLDESTSFAETTRAWQRLAAAMDWPVDRAFDELLGRRVAIVLRDLDSGRPDWAILTVVSVEAERRMRESLRAAPRAIVGGMPVLAVEDGKYELVIGRVAGSFVDPAQLGSSSPGSTVLLTPSTGTLLPELAPMLPSRSGLAGRAPEWTPGGRECDLTFVLRQQARAGSASRFLCITAMQEATGWDARLVCSPGLIWDRAPADAAIKPWTDGAFNTLQRDALFAVMGVPGASPVRLAGIVPGLETLIPALPLALGQAGAPEGQLSGVFIRPAQAPARPPQITARADAPARTDQNAPAHLSITVAVQARDRAAAASTGDNAIARFIALLQSGQAELDDNPPAVQHDGAVSEQSVRRLALDGAFPIHEDHAALLQQALGEEPVLTWGTGPAGPAVARAGSRPDPAGWWIASLLPQAAATGDALSRVSAVLSGPEAGSSRPRLSVGIIRPAAIDQFVAAAPGVLPPLGSLRRVESIRWDAWLRSDGAVEGTLGIRLTR